MSKHLIIPLVHGSVVTSDFHEVVNCIRNELNEVFSWKDVFLVNDPVNMDDYDLKRFFSSCNVLLVDFMDLYPEEYHWLINLAIRNYVDDVSFILHTLYLHGDERVSSYIHDKNEHLDLARKYDSVKEKIYYLDVYSSIKQQVKLWSTFTFNGVNNV